jgi:N-acetylglucosaminyldiphosphoundecaprenol N-acetyl-beta-D-mannosaminyltransferase
MNKTIPSVSLMDYSIFSADLSELSFGKKRLISTLNQYSFCIAEEDPEFKKALIESDMLLPDGMAIVAAIRILKGQRIKKIAGADLHHFLLNYLNHKGGKCFYLGSSQNTLTKITSRISSEFPNIKVETFSPAYKLEFSDYENQQMIAAINSFNPDVLFVGMTAPKQEKWAYKNKDSINAETICSIGAVFDFYAGTIQRPNSFWIRLRLEWFIRLIKEPKRMSKRYLYYGPIFINLILKEGFRMFFSKKE